MWSRDLTHRGCTQSHAKLILIRVLITATSIGISTHEIQTTTSFLTGQSLEERSVAPKPQLKTSVKPQPASGAET